MRSLLRRFRRRWPHPRPAILMYHRVAAAPAADPWGLAVHPARFQSQLDMLAAKRTPLPLSELVRRLQLGSLPADAVAITFDDGYVDNLQQAAPRLAAAHAPATVFLAAGAVGQRREFWWDEVARGILERPHALDAAVVVDGRPCRLAFAAITAADRTAGNGWRAWQEPRTARQRAYLQLWAVLRDTSPAARDAALTQFRELTAITAPQPADLPMTPDEVGRLTREYGIELGGHTLTHPVLPQLAPPEKRREILDGKRRCEELTGAPIDGFAYPHGAVDDDCKAAVRDSGFRWACGTTHGFVTSSCDPYALPRIFVQDWDAAALEAALS
jgi:peptidoglycan/xylan/chitin deacetylase (PgdA/CDA1 family)